MKIVSIQEAYQRKFARQRAVKELKYNASGHCVHIGKLSPGCYSCFAPNSFCVNIIPGIKCNLDCVYCATNKKRKDFPAQRQFEDGAALCKRSFKKNYKPTRMSFSGGGEPLLYMDIIKSHMKTLHYIEKRTKHKPWYYLYTNGLLANARILAQLKELGFDEIRFHLGASNFSKAAYDNLKKAVRYLKVVSVETPAWEPHRKKLFEMLPKIEEIGVKHLNIGEIEIEKYNYKKISKIMPKAEIYQCYLMHLYDGGLVYDIMEEVIRKKYSFSVIDCSCFVKSIQRAPAKHICHEDVSGLCAKY